MVWSRYSADVAPAATIASTTTSRRQPDERQLPFADAVCLVLVVQGLTHGWAIGSVLAPGGELGRIWSLSRPLTYRAIDGLVDRGLVTRRGQVAGRGRDRVIVGATAAGRRYARRWLDAPVEHLRDVRTELLVKLWLRERAGLDRASLLDAQQRVFQPAIAALGASRPGDDLVDIWRRESAGAVRRFLDQALDAVPPAVDQTDPTIPRTEWTVKLSARNQLKATVDAVNHGEVMSTVRVALPDGQRITAAITKDAAEDLGVAPGDDVIVIIKSTEVILAKES